MKSLPRCLALILTLAMLLPLAACASPSLAPTAETETVVSSCEAEAPATTAPPVSTPPKKEYNMTQYSFDQIAPNIHLLGERCNITDAGLVSEWACTGFEMSIQTEGTDLVLGFDCNYTNFFKVYVDGAEPKSRVIVGGKGEKIAVKDLPAGTHTIQVVKDSQPSKDGGYCTITSVSFDGVLLSWATAPKDLCLEFIGDSIWCGVGALGNQGSSPDYSEEISATTATPWRVAKALDADLAVTARGSIGIVTAAGAYTMEQLFPRLNGYRDEVPFEAKRSPDAVVICLGTNDPNAKSEEFVEKGKAFVAMLREYYGPDTKIVWTYGIMFKGKMASEIGRIAEACGGAAAGVYTLEMIQGQNGSGSKDNNRHPSSADHEKNADLLIPFLKEILKD